MAISTPNLWRHLSLAQTRPSSEALNIILDRLGIFLARARDMSLDMFLLVGLNNVAQEPAVRIMMQHIDRCRSFHVLSYSQGHSIDFLPLPGALPLLTSLSIEIVAMPNSRPLTQVLTEENIAPLEDLKLHIGRTDAGLTMSGLLKPVRTEKLLKVSLSGPTFGGAWAESVNFLTQCPMVQEVDISTPIPYAAFDAPAAIALPDLKSLGFGDYLPLGFEEFIQTPNLEVLKVYGDGGFRNTRDRSGRIARANTGHNACRFPHLHSFILGHFVFTLRDITDLRTFFERNPTIRTITISESEGSLILLYAILGIDADDEDPSNDQTPQLPPLSPGDMRSLPASTRLIISETGPTGITLPAFENQVTQTLGQMMRRWESLYVECDWRSINDESEAVSRFKDEFGDRLVQVGTDWE